MTSRPEQSRRWYQFWPFSEETPVTPSNDLPLNNLGTQTENPISSLPPLPPHLLRPHNLKSMKKYPVDDNTDEELLFQRSGDLNSSISSQNQDQPSQVTIISPKKSANSVHLDLDLFHSSTATSDPLYAPYGFIIMCCFQVVWGLVGTIQVLVFRYVKALSNPFILLDKNFSDHSPFYLMAAASLSLLGGICGLIALAFDKTFLFHMIPHFTWMILTMCLSSSITARGNLETPTVSSYYRLFEATSLYNMDPTYLKEVWPGVDPNIWEEMQKHMKCCGVNNVTDWLQLPAQSIPSSCCLEDNENCAKVLDTWKSGKSREALLTSVKEVTKYLYEDSCIKMLTLERGNHIRDWTTYPLIYLAFHLLIMFNLNYLTQLLINEHRTWQGIARLELFKSQSMGVLKSKLLSAFFKMIPFFCEDKKREVQAMQNEKRGSRFGLFYEEVQDLGSLTGEDLALTDKFNKIPRTIQDPHLPRSSGGILHKDETQASKALRIKNALFLKKKFKKSRDSLKPGIHKRSPMLINSPSAIGRELEQIEKNLKESEEGNNKKEGVVKEWSWKRGQQK